MSKNRITIKGIPILLLVSIAWLLIGFGTFVTQLFSVSYNEIWPYQYVILILTSLIMFVFFFVIYNVSEYNNKKNKKNKNIHSEPILYGTFGGAIPFVNPNNNTHKNSVNTKQNTILKLCWALFLSLIFVIFYLR